MSKVIIYHGPETAGVGVDIDSDFAFFPFGEPVEVGDELAARLLEEYPGTFSTSEHPQRSADKAAWHAFRAAQGHQDVDDLTKSELIALPDVPAPTEKKEG
jgi:hypothetical protein